MERMTGMVTTFSWDLDLCDLARLLTFGHCDMLVLTWSLCCCSRGPKVLEAMREKDGMWDEIVISTDLIHPTFLKDLKNDVAIVKLLKKGGLEGPSIMPCQSAVWLEFLVGRQCRGYVL